MNKEEKVIELTYDELLYKYEVLKERFDELEKKYKFNDGVIREQRNTISQTDEIIKLHIKEKEFLKEIILFIIERR